MIQKNHISLIVAVYNMGEEVGSLCESIVHEMESLDESFELTFVDDGSTDETGEILKGYAQKDDRIRLVRMRMMFVEAAALDAGLKYSTGERIVYLSGRVRVNPRDIQKILARLNEGQDLVVGWRTPRRDAILNRWVSWLFNKLASRISRVKLHDINSGIIGTSRSVFQKVQFYGDLYNFIPILAAQQGYRVTEEQVEQMKGTFRKSRNPKEVLRRLLDIITVFFSRYSKKPIHFLGFVGTLFMLSGFGILLYLFIYRILQMGPIAGRPLLILGALVLVIGIQMISIGLLGEMIIFTHAGEIEEYNIEEIVE